MHSLTSYMTSLTVFADPVGLQKFMLALPQAACTPIQNSKSGASLICLPSPLSWLQLKPQEPLFVRSFYQGCYEGVMGKLAPGKRFVVIGNSGSKLLCIVACF
jgi:hypothetical protein